jgi:hypothetical protein
LNAFEFPQTDSSAGVRAGAQSLADRTIAVLAVLASAITLVTFNGGVNIGSSNHVGLLPVVRRILDPGYLPGDFNIELRLYHHRVFAYLLAGLSAVFGEEHAIITLHVIGALLMAASLWFLCRALNLSLLGYFTITLFLAAGFLWTGRGLEENTFLGVAEVQPPLFAHSFVLLAAAFLIRRQYRAAAFTAGLTVLFHLQIGATATLMFAPFFAARLRQFGVRETVRLGLYYLIPAWPAALHLFEMMDRGLLQPASTEWSLPFYIDFRHPHHFELMSATHAWWVGGHILVMAVIWILLRRLKPKESAGVGVLAGASVMLGVLALIHFGDYYFLKQDRIANLQMIRLSPLITLFGALSLIALIEIASKVKGPRWLPVAASVALLLLGAGSAVQAARRPDGSFSFAIHRYADAPSDWAEICAWIKDNGPRDSIYLTPPGTPGFTVLTDRSTLVEFKINPDGALNMAEWFERLRDLSGGQLPTERGLKNRKPLNRAFATLSAEQLRALGEKYHARYAVLPKGSGVELDTLYKNEGYRLVRLD